jgi:hypothetical protein
MFQVWVTVTKERFPNIMQNAAAQAGTSPWPPARWWLRLQLQALMIAARPSGLEA